jgi:plastocyanin
MKLNFVGIGIIVQVIGVITFSGCTEIPGSNNTIIIQNSTFNPNQMNVTIGTAVYWVNRDSVNHTVVSDSGVFESKILEPGNSFHYNFDKEGEYTYHDGLNSSITGKIIAYNPKPAIK